MLDLRNYLIHKNVHVYQQGDLNIAYDVNSGSLHVLDEQAFALLKEIGEIQKVGNIELDCQEEILAQAGTGLSASVKNRILDEFGELQAQKILFSPEIAETEPSYPETPLLKAMCLHVAHDCNLRCRYCFADTGPFQGKRELMSAQTGKLALDFLLKHCGPRQKCEVDFFGGEPLMNFAVVQELIAYGREKAAAVGKEINFTLTTNGVLLDEAVADYLEAEGVSVVLSLDGRKEVNDFMRPDVGGRGSYDRVVPRILNFIAKRPNTSPYATGQYYYVRGTYTHYNLDFYRDVLHMADLGIKRISVEPVVAPPEADYALREEDIVVLEESYDVLAQKIMEYRERGQDFSFFHFNAGLADGPCLPKLLSGCGAGHEYVAIAPNGDIYPCHQFVGQDRFKMGSLYDFQVKLKKDVVQKFRKAHIYSKEECRSCWARFSCSGGCHAANNAFGGGLNRVYDLGCKLQKKRLEVAYYLKIKEALKRERNKSLLEE